MKCSLLVQVTVLAVFFLLSILVILPYIDYCLLRPTYLCLGDTILLVYDETVIINGYTCRKTAEAKIVEPGPNKKWYKPIIDFSSPPYIFQAVYLETKTETGYCQEWITLTNVDPYLTSEDYCSDILNMWACTQNPSPP